MTCWGPDKLGSPMGKKPIGTLKTRRFWVCLSPTHHEGGDKIAQGRDESEKQPDRANVCNGCRAVPAWFFSTRIPILPGVSEGGVDLNQQCELHLGWLHLPLRSPASHSLSPPVYLLCLTPSHLCLYCCISTSTSNIYGLPSAGFICTVSCWVLLPACAHRWVKVHSPHPSSSHPVSGSSDFKKLVLKTRPSEVMIGTYRALKEDYRIGFISQHVISGRKSILQIPPVERCGLEKLSPALQ